MARSIKGPGGSNEYSNPPKAVTKRGWEDPCGVEPQGSAPGANYVASPRRVGRTTRSISGPGGSPDEIKYRGT